MFVLIERDSTYVQLLPTTYKVQSGQVERDVLKNRMNRRKQYVEVTLRRYMSRTRLFLVYFFRFN